MHKLDELSSRPLNYRKGEEENQLKKVSPDPYMHSVAHMHPYSYTLPTPLYNNNKQVWYEDASLVLWNIEQCKEILDVTREKANAQINCSNYEHKLHFSVSELWSTWVEWMIFSPLQALLTHCLTQKSAVEKDTAALKNGASFHHLGQQQDPEVQFLGASKSDSVGGAWLFPVMTWRHLTLVARATVMVIDANKKIPLSILIHLWVQRNVKIDYVKRSPWKLKVFDIFSGGGWNTRNIQFLS